MSELGFPLHQKEKKPSFSILAHFCKTSFHPCERHYRSLGVWGRNSPGEGAGSVFSSSRLPRRGMTAPPHGHPREAPPVLGTHTLMLPPPQFATPASLPITEAERRSFLERRGFKRGQLSSSDHFLCFLTCTHLFSLEPCTPSSFSETDHRSVRSLQRP